MSLLKKVEAATTEKNKLTELRKRLARQLYTELSQVSEKFPVIRELTVTWDHQIYCKIHDNEVRAIPARCALTACQERWDLRVSGSLLKDLNWNALLYHLTDLVVDGKVPTTERGGSL